MAGCPPIERLEESLVGPELDAEILAHVDACRRCQDRAARIRANNELAANLAATTGTKAPLSDVIQTDQSGARGHARKGRSQRFGNYEVIELVSRGGQGVVYRARQSGTDRDVALKILPRGVATDEEHRARFRREAKSAARLNHPNIVTVYETGVAGGLHYIAMEYVAGQSLEQVTRRQGALYEAQIIEIALAVGNALQHAHSRGVLHRDVKPGNILIASDRRVKLTDFGLAKHDASDTSFQTREGGIFGTAAYLSPEQSYGSRKLDLRTDIYSLGCVIYNMAAGEPPFKGDNPFAVIDQHRRGSRPFVRSANSSISAALEALIIRAMAIDPHHRYPTVQDLMDDLKRIRTALKAPETVEGGLEQIVQAVDQINVVGRQIRDATPSIKPPSWQSRVTATFLTRPIFWLAMFLFVLILVAVAAFLIGTAVGADRQTPTM